MTTLQKLVDQIAIDMARDEAAIKMHNVIARALARFEGKSLTKRLTAYIREQLPKDASITFDGDCIRVWNVPDFEDYAQRSTHYLPSVGYPYERLEAFHRNSDACNGEAAIRRNFERTELMKDPNHLSVLSMAIDQHNEAFRRVAALIDHGILGHPVNYASRRLLEGTEEHKRAEDEAREARRNKR